MLSVKKTSRKPFHFVGGCQKEYQGLPEDVQDVFGRLLLDAQEGDHPEGSKPFGEKGRPEIQKLSEDHDRNTYRMAYTAFKRAVYGLHAFKKSRNKGTKLPSGTGI
jgi:phage-related protein